MRKITASAVAGLIATVAATSPPTGAEARQPGRVPAYTATKPVILRRTPSTRGGAVRTVQPGELVYPIGLKSGIWWQADDENGNRGWVTSPAISPR
jgi:uncharacterized protein YgiM (DUF1202 family)